MPSHNAEFKSIVNTLTYSQVQAIRCAHADLVGALQNFENQTYSEHDWKAHKLSISELESEFDFLGEVTYILPTNDQPMQVLVEYILYSEGKIDIGEVPMNFTQWALIEIDNESPIADSIKRQ